MGLKASNITLLDLLDSLFTIKQVWQNKLTPANILNCFRKAGFIYETPEVFQVLEEEAVIAVLNDDELPTSETLTEVETHEEIEVKRKRTNRSLKHAR